MIPGAGGRVSRRALVLGGLALALGLGIAAFVLRPGGHGPRTPELVLHGFLRALAAGDYDAAAATAEAPLARRATLVRLRFALALDLGLGDEAPVRAAEGWSVRLADGRDLRLRATVEGARVRDVEPLTPARPPLVPPPDPAALAGRALRGVVAALRDADPEGLRRWTAWPLRDGTTPEALAAELKGVLPDEPVLAALTTAEYVAAAPAAPRGRLLRVPVRASLPGGATFEVTALLLREGDTWRIAGLEQ